MYSHGVAALLVTRNLTERYFHKNFRDLFPISQSLNARARELYGETDDRAWKVDPHFSIHDSLSQPAPIYPLF